jgi:hypothetical protein
VVHGPSGGAAPLLTAANSATVPIEDLQQLKILADRLGKGRVRALLNLLG